MHGQSLKRACELISEEVKEISEQKFKHKQNIFSRFECLFIRIAPSLAPFITFWLTKRFAYTASSNVQVLKILDIIENTVIMELTYIPVFVWKTIGVSK